MMPSAPTRLYAFYAWMLNQAKTEKRRKYVNLVRNSMVFIEHIWNTLPIH